MFELGGTISRSHRLLLTAVGVVVLLGLWWGLAEALAVDKKDYTPIRLDDPAFHSANRDSLLRLDSIAYENAPVTGKMYPILPTPLMVLKSYPKLFNPEKDDLFGNAAHSIWLNLQGYFWAILISLPLGFLLGLIPFFSGLFGRPVDAMRYIPISALTGLFILWFGAGDAMKVAFLAFGILVYMIPVVVQRIREVQEVHVQTVFTLGATNWQTVKKVYLPEVLSKFIDDLRVLTAISWTYIIIAEIVNRGKGLGSLIYGKARVSETDSVFAILVVIILIGIIQDKLFVWLDKRLFPHKYYKQKVGGLKEIQMGIAIVFLVMLLAILLPLFGVNLAAASNFFWLVIAASVVLVLMGEFKLWKSSKE